ncbi:hypothetical protein BJ741DRAFT_670437 [Chytriomyces cf. hyalinus JEL632]|nr:hypothetical protein BJ741DRAFT_670437 [Chytriomyces cf. hyalinus JEL632]
MTEGTWSVQQESVAWLMVTNALCSLGTAVYESRFGGWVVVAGHPQKCSNSAQISLRIRPSSTTTPPVPHIHYCINHNMRATVITRNLSVFRPTASLFQAASSHSLRSAALMNGATKTHYADSSSTSSTAQDSAANASAEVNDVPVFVLDKELVHL